MLYKLAYTLRRTRNKSLLCNNGKSAIVANYLASYLFQIPLPVASIWLMAEQIYASRMN